MNILQRFWYEWLKRPYNLAAPIVEGKGQTVVLLHGLATDHRSWGYVLPHISEECRVIAFDLLGFGESPIPAHLAYTPQEHAAAVIASLNRRGIRRNVIVVGHSMGALIAVEVAKQRPQLVKRLILCSMPVYRFDSKRRLLPHQESVYARIYRRMQKERFALGAFQRYHRLRRDSWLEFGVNKDNFHTFRNSLANTIMKQTTFQDIQALAMPIDMVCGRFDAFVIRRHLQALSGLLQNGTLMLLNEAHDIGARYGMYVAELVNAAAESRAPRTDILKQKIRSK